MDFRDVRAISQEVDDSIRRREITSAGETASDR